MTKFFIFSLLALTYANTAISAPWWDQLTVCRMDTSRCYTVMGAGFDSEMWDAKAKCRGMKYICPEALASKTTTPILISRDDTDNNDIIKSDYDTELLSNSGDCFGQRRTNKSGNQVMVNGKYVNIYCDGILPKPDEILENGEIVYEKQPTCETLKKDGFVAVENGKCFGKYYDESEYYIDCGHDLKPKQIIVLNGAQYTTTTDNAPKTSNAAKQLFNKMLSVSKSQKAQYFNK